MFIREMLTCRTANKIYRFVRLVESRRVGRKVQQKTLLNLGASFKLAKPQQHGPIWYASNHKM